MEITVVIIFSPVSVFLQFLYWEDNTIGLNNRKVKPFLILIDWVVNFYYYLSKLNTVLFL
ncbi:MAG: hypothetical protein B6230_06255 [Desulfobacteraceae bacterium 4572_89]|nr:MAG: hypothetical protein B6230_06255 [Desulfobacteraceae bacterium 4572_89]